MKDDIRKRLIEAVKRDADRHNKLENEQREKEEAKELSGLLGIQEGSLDCIFTKGTRL